MKKISKTINDIVLCFLLFTFSLALIFTFFFSKDKSFSDKENRVLKTRPKFSFEKLLDGKYFSEFTKYCTDQFPYRETFTGVSSIIDLSMGRTETNSIIVSGEKVLISRHDYQNLQVLNENLKAISSFIKRNNENSLPTFITVAPRSIDINKEKLPNYFSSSYGVTEYNELYKSIDPSNLIDTLPSLSTATESGTKTFYNTDHHWTTHGAYIAYLEIAKMLNVVPYPIDYFNIQTVSTDFLGTSFQRSALYDFEYKDEIVLYRYENDNKITVTKNEESQTLYDFSALETTDKYSVFLGGNTDIIKIKNSTKRQKLMLIKDSFANSVIPFLALHFDIDVIDFRYYKGNISQYLTSNEFDAVLILYGIDTLATETSCANIEK